MPHTPEEKKQAQLRVRRIKGQVEALDRALESGADCSSVLQQLAAIRGAVNGLMSTVLESHIRGEFNTDPSHAQLVSDMTALVRTYLC